MTFECAIRTGRVVAGDGERDAEIHRIEAYSFDQAYAIIRARWGIKPKQVLMLRPLGQAKETQES